MENEETQELDATSTLQNFSEADMYKEFLLNGFQQGQLLITKTTSKWTKDQIDKGEYEEAKLILRHFTVADEGKSREFIAKCKDPNHANAIVHVLNAYLPLLEENRKLKEQIQQANDHLYHKDISKHIGLTKREYFAAMAMQGILGADTDITAKEVLKALELDASTPYEPLKHWPMYVAKYAIASADELLNQLSK